MERVFTSTAVCGQVRWPKVWDAGNPPKKAHVVVGSRLIIKTAERIAMSEGYEFDSSAISWCPEDPNDVLRDFKRRSEAFWEDPHCSDCAARITPEDTRWWRDGEAFCGLCSLVAELGGFMTKGRTEREIESHVHIRRLTFRKHRSLMEEALHRLGAWRAPNGTWLPRSTQEGAA